MSNQTQPDNCHVERHGLTVGEVTVRLSKRIAELEAEVARLKAHAEAMAEAGEYMLATHEDNDGGMLIERSARKPWSWAVIAYRRDYPKEPEVSFADCKNQDCPIGCPDSHALDYHYDPKETV